jgi:hypothetical protein
MTQIRPSLPAWLRRRGQGWQALLVLLLLSVLDALLNDTLSLWGLLPEVAQVIPDMVTLSFNGALFAVALFAWLWPLRRLARPTVLLYLGVVTIQIIGSALLLVASLAEYKQGPGAFELLWDAAIVWGSNVLTFAVWYWLLDGDGSPPQRETDGPPRRDFAFPLEMNEVPGWAGWRPRFLDYLFLAFSTSTAFSPTDTMVLSRRAKLLTMAQASVSLITLAMLAARAINIIT